MDNIEQSHLIAIALIGGIVTVAVWAARGPLWAAGWVALLAVLIGLYALKASDE